MAQDRISFCIQKTVIRHIPGRELKGKWTLEIIHTPAIYSDGVLELLNRKIKKMTHEEQCGKDTLIEIYHTNVDVVRWCQICGAVVVDVDYDGRTNPGAVMPMRFPILRNV